MRDADVFKAGVHIPRLVIAGAALAAVVGCEPAGRINLHQPQFPGWQKQIRIETETVCWAEAENTQRVLASFPLPGARTGRPTYVLYLRYPVQRGEIPFDSAAGGAGHGFLVQTRGDNAGLAQITGGSVRVRGSGSAERHLDVKLTCEDGTRIEGRLHAQRDDHGLARFETHEHPADVQAIQGKKATQPSASTRPGS